MSVLVDIADEVVTLINGHEWDIDFTAKRLFNPNYVVTEAELQSNPDAELLDSLRVAVIPLGPKLHNRESKSAASWDYSIRVAFNIRVDSPSSDVTQYATLVEDVQSLLYGVSLSSGATVVKTDCHAVADPSALKDKVFFSFFDLTYRLLR